MKKTLMTTIIVLVMALGIGTTAAFADDLIPLEDAKIRLGGTSFEYTGYRIEPSVSVTYNGSSIDSWHYNTLFSKNINVGTATVTVKGDNEWTTGSCSCKFKIRPKKIRSCKIKNTYTYTGRKIIPSVCDGNNSRYRSKDYVISFPNGHKKIGTHTAKIRFRGNYTGTVKKTFKIVPRGVRGIRVKKTTYKSINVKWAKTAGATGYIIYRYNSNKGKYLLYRVTKKRTCTIKRCSKDDMTINYKVRSYKKVKGKKYVSADPASRSKVLRFTRPKFTLSRCKNSLTFNFNASKYYEIQVCDNKKFSGAGNHYLGTWKPSRSITVYILGMYSHTSYYPVSVRIFTVSNLDSGKYYARARCYHDNDKGTKTLYGKWSKAKTIKVR